MEGTNHTDQHNPKEFLSYILQELTLDEREVLMADEAQRRKTFLASWPHEGHLSGAQMAQAGFYYLGNADHVQCVFCRGRLHKWSVNDNPMAEHARLFNFCRFVKGLNCGNREYRSKKLTKEELHNITRFGSQTVEEQRRNRDGGADSGPLGICTNRAAVIRYAPDSARLRTFARWPTHNPIAAELLCDAGFYYTGFDDQVRCFSCSGGLREWAENDNPWEEHARWFPDCPYLLNKKGNDYVDEVHDKTPDNKKCARKTQKQKKVESKKQTVLSEQEEMERICELLGHSRESIRNAVSINGGPFTNIKDMIGMLHSFDIDVYIAVQYPPTYNPLLPAGLESHLNAMTARDFLHHINARMTEPERKSLMVSERQRCKTFMAGWPHEAIENLTGAKMAKAGFYYLDEEDRVKCVFCEGSLHGWASDDVPMNEHRRLFSFCRFVNGLECDNIVCKVSIELTDFKQITFFDKVLQEKENSRQSDVMEICEPLRIHPPRAYHMNYAIYVARMNTFQCWSSSVSADDLCGAGFFFAGPDDLVRCFFCSGGLRDWSNGNDPWQEHARWFPQCTYLVQKKGTEYINKVHRETPHGKKSSRIPTNPVPDETYDNGVNEVDQSEGSPQDVGSHNDGKLITVKSQTFNKLGCRKCYNVQAHHVSLPCGHLFYCNACTEEERVKSDSLQYSLPRCKECKVRINAALKFYY